MIDFFLLFSFSLAGGWKCCKIGKSRYFGINRSSFAHIASPECVGCTLRQFVCREIQGWIPSLCRRSVKLFECYRPRDIGADHQALEQLHEPYGTEFGQSGRNAYASTVFGRFNATTATATATSHPNSITEPNKCACRCRCCCRRRCCAPTPSITIVGLVIQGTITGHTDNASTKAPNDVSS